jgi:hypothetical protein
MKNVTITGRSALAANFHKFEESARQKVLAAQAENGAEHRQRMSDEAPRETGFTAANTEVRFSPEGYTYDVGYWAETYAAAGLDFYVIYPLFGTSTIQANDWVVRASEPMREIAPRRIGDAIKEAAREASTE